MDTTVKLDLLGLGTRYDHYMELKEAFEVGIEMLTNALKLEDNLTSRENLKRLQNAATSIEARINFLADWSRKTTRYSSFGQELSSIAPHRPPQLMEAVVSETTRRECEEELKKAGETGYAQDSSQKSNTSGEGTSPQNPE